MDDFNFEYDSFHPRFSSHDMLDSLRAFAALRNNQPFSHDEYAAWPHRLCGANTITQRFRGWRKALLAAGLKPNRPFRYTEEELMTNLESVWRSLRRPPYHKDLRAVGLCGQPYLARWGSLRAACLLLSRHKRGQLSREELTAKRDIRRRRKPISSSLRYQILERDHFRCTCCGANPATNPSVTLELDHITPVSKGGTNHPSNLRTLCSNCNRGKSDRDPAAEPAPPQATISPASVAHPEVAAHPHPAPPTDRTAPPEPASSSPASSCPLRT